MASSISIELLRYSKQINFKIFVSVHFASLSIQHLLLLFQPLPAFSVCLSLSSGSLDPPFGFFNSRPLQTTPLPVLLCFKIFCLLPSPSFLLFCNGGICGTATFIGRHRIYTDSHTHMTIDTNVKFPHAVSLMGETEQCSPNVTFTRYEKYVHVTEVPPRLHLG